MNGTHPRTPLTGSDRINTDDPRELEGTRTGTGYGGLAGSSLFAAYEEEVQLKSTLLDNMLDGVLAHTLDGLIVYVNQPACDLFGIAQNDFIDLEPWGWVAPGQRAFIRERVDKLVAEGGMVFESTGAPHADGSVLHTEVHARIVDTALHGKLMVSVVRDITERIRGEERVRHLAFHDTLTGLPNRVLLEDRLNSALAAADRHGDVVGVVYIDLDDFKPVNDTLGHAMGDKVLRTVAERLQSCVRDSDTIARLGGDEFFALFPRLRDDNDLVTCASQLATCVSAPIEIDGHTVQVTASLGLARYILGEAPDELMTRADHAMYRAKQHGLLGWEEFLSR